LRRREDKRRKQKKKRKAIRRNTMNILQIMNERKVDELEVTGEQLKEYLDSGEHTHTQCSIEFPIRGNYGHVLVDNIEIAKMLTE